MTTYGIMAALLLAQAEPGAGGPTPAPAGAAPATQGPSAPAPADAGAPPELRTITNPPLLTMQTVTLEQALRDAAARNLDLKAAAARLEQSKELHWRAWSAYLPQVTAGGTFTHNHPGDISFPLPTAFAVQARAVPGVQSPGEPPLPPADLPGRGTDLFVTPSEFTTVQIQKADQLAAQIQLNQALVAPQAWYGIAAARAGERLAADNVEAARRDILFGAAQAYYGAIASKQLVAIQERQLAITLDHEKDARVRYDAGAAPKVTLLRAEIDRARAEQDLKRARNTHLSAKESLATILDRRADFDVDVPPSPPLPAELEPLVETAPRDRPDVQATAEQRTVAEKNRDAVLMRYVPTLGAFARYQYANVTGFTGTNTSWVIGLALNWTILDGFLRESDLRESSARIREAEAQQASAVARARNEVRVARLDLDSAVANREKAKEQLSFAQENQRLVNVNYRAGAATYIEVSDANAALLQAELQLLTEGVNADLAALRVLKAAGLFNPQ